MARVKALSWLGIVTGLALTPAGLEAAPSATSLISILQVEAVPGQSLVRPSLAREALSSAIDLHLKGDYEKAAAWFQKAQEGQADLSAADKKDLTSYMQANTSALIARRDGGELLRQAEKANRDGKSSLASDLLKKVAVHGQYLNPTDRQKLAQLNEKLKGRGQDLGKAANPSVLARAKIQQARAMMAQGNLSAAEQLAVEAGRLPATYDLKEDTPAKVQDDLAKMKTDPKALLTAARISLKKGDLDQAEIWAQMSEKHSSTFSFTFSSDSPAKVLKEVKSAKLAKAMPAKSGPEKDPSKKSPGKSLFGGKEEKIVKKDEGARTVGAVDQKTGATVKMDAKVESARRLLKEARQALHQGNLEQAAKYNDQAAALHADLPFYEDHPDKVRAEIHRLSATTVAASMTASKEDPRELLKKGQELYKAGQLDQALITAQKAKAVKTSWGLFEDTPDSLMKDIEKTRAKRDQEESAKVLVEARKMFDAGDFESALQASYRAEKLHGPYSLWDLGDQPQKLRGEIEIAKAKGRKSTIPPVPGSEIAKNTTGGDGRIYQARQLLTDARKAMKSGDMTRAANLAVQARGLQVASYKPGEDTPDKVLRDIDQMRRGSQPVVRKNDGPKIGLEASPDVKQQAQRLLAQARDYQRQGYLKEARQKALEAQQLRASFGPEESSPEQVLLQLAAVARKGVENLVLHADDCMAKASSDPRLFQQADADLQQARRLAAAYGQDTLPIDSKIGYLRQALAQNSAVPPPALQQKSAQTAGAGQAKGLDLLEKARLELRRGDTGTSRRLAVEAYQGNFGVKNEAAQVMRSIDAEEEGQRRLTANHTFEAGKAAFVRQDYSHAARIFVAVDPQLLNANNQARFKEYMNSAELIPYMPEGSYLAKGTDTGIRRASAQAEQGKAQISDQGGDFATQYQALRDIEFQRLRSRGQEVQREAAERFKSGDAERSLDVLQEYLAALQNTQLDTEKITLLRRPIEMRLQQFKTLKADRDRQQAQLASGKEHAASRSHQFETEQLKQKHVAELMHQYNGLYREGKYEEAETKAMLAHEMDPDNAMAAAAVNMAKLASAHKLSGDAKKSRENMLLYGLGDVENQGPLLTTKKPLAYDLDRWKIAQGRKPTVLPVGLRKNARELEIERILLAPCTINFVDTPLRKVIEDLRQWHSLNIDIDENALKEELISLDHPITAQLDGISLKSALKLILDKVHLTSVIEDEVLRITTEAHSRGKLVTHVYPVADLVISVPNFDGSNNPLMKAIAANPASPIQATIPSLVPPTNSLGGSQATAGGFASSRTTESITKERAKDTMEDTLMNLIMKTVSPTSWANQGGPGTIEYFPLTLALVVSQQTTDIQDQIGELLAALRRLQDQEVAIEIKLISIDESFFERIGVNFNVNINTNNRSNIQSELTSGQFQTAGQVNNFNGNGSIIGLTPAGTFTNDLNIPINVSSFAQAIPPFGGFPNIPGGNGGIDLGLAFLSDIQVFMFMEAAQGDRRTNIMQAPKITMFNGQTSTITVTDSQFFLMNVSVAAQNGVLTFIPQNTPVPFGVNVTIQAVISADRRFVRLSLAPTLTTLTNALVPLFPIVTPIQTFFEGGFNGPTVNFTQFIQQPSISTVMVMTTVAVPDGGTVLMGGLKRLSEGRNESGPPILSKIPYIDRLFKNVGYGRDVESLMIMVTPRIIINEEEETIATGVVSNPEK